MSIFGKLVSAIFGSSQTAGPAPTSWGPSATTTSSPGSPSAGPAPAAGAPAATGKPMSRLELEALIEKTAAQQREDLNWQESIVDLMKLFKLDSSLGARKRGERAGLHRCARRLGGDEHLAAPTGHGEAGRERRQGAGAISRHKAVDLASP
jgi:Domain of unknown function (DUF3597)